MKKLFFSPVRNTAKAARACAKLTGKIHAHFPSGIGGGRYIHNPIRQGTPIITDDGVVGIRAYNGLWMLRASLVPNENADGTPMRNAAGRIYKARVRFDATHVAWFDDPQGPKTPAQVKDALNMHAYRTRTQK